MERPDLTLDYKVGTEKKTIKWSYGLSCDLQRLIPTMDEGLSAFIQRPDLQDYLLRRALTEKKGFIKEDSELISPEEIDEIDPDEVLKILEWIQGHLMYFFASSAEFTHRRAKEFQKDLQQLNPSTAGSQGSPSTTQPAGPSE